MQDVGRVDVLQTAEGLVNERLEVRICQRLTAADDGRQIAVHQLFIQEDLIVVASTFGNVHIEKTYDLQAYQLKLSRWTHGPKDIRCGGL